MRCMFVIIQRRLWFQKKEKSKGRKEVEGWKEGKRMEGREEWRGGGGGGGGGEEEA